MTNDGIVRMVGLGSGLMGLLMAAACGGNKESESQPVEQDGKINAAACYGEGTKCKAPEKKELPPHCLGEAEKCPVMPDGRTLAPRVPVECPLAPAGTLTAESMTVVSPGLQEMVAASDGTLWALGKTEEGDVIAFWAEHFDSDGHSLGRNEAVARHENATEPVAHLAATAEGGAVVYAHFMDQPPDADSPLVQHASVVRLDSAAAKVGAPIELSALSGGQVVVSPQGITVAATAAGIEQRGSLVRLSSAGAPVFVQNAVPTTGRALGSGIGGLAVEGDGSATVLSEQFRDFQQDHSLFGIARFDASGNLTENWILPLEMAGGYGAKMVTSNGMLAVRGTVSNEQDVVQTFSADGEAGFAWSLPYSGMPEITADPVTHSVLAWAGSGLAIIAPDGTSCGVYDVEYPGESASLPVLVASGGFLYQLADGALTRVALP